jgi:aspartate oxidase
VVQLAAQVYKMQKEAGIEDSPDKFYNDFITMGGGEKNLNKVIARKHAEESGNAIDWLQDYVGVKFNGKVDSGGYLTMNTNRVTYTAGGAASGGASIFLRQYIRNWMNLLRKEPRSYLLIPK